MPFKLDKKGSSFIEFLFASALLLVGATYVISSYTENDQLNKVSHLANNIGRIFESVNKAHPANQEILTINHTTTDDFIRRRDDALQAGFNYIDDKYIDDVIEDLYRNKITDLGYKLGYRKAGSTITFTTKVHSGNQCQTLVTNLEKTGAVSVDVGNHLLNYKSIKPNDIMKACSEKKGRSKGVEIEVSYCTPLLRESSC